MINVKTITDKFIKPVKLSKEGYMWCIDNSNTIISHPDENIIGQKVDDVLKNKIDDFENYKINKDNKETFDFFELLAKENNGFGESVDFLNGEKSLAVFKTVAIGNKSWKLIINMPYSEINNPIIENAKKTYGLVFIIIFVLT
jgi:outer membrane lipoprotein-sorting protein